MSTCQAEILNYSATRAIKLAELEKDFNETYDTYKNLNTADATFGSVENQLNERTKILMDVIKTDLVATTEQHQTYLKKKNHIEENDDLLRMLRPKVEHLSEKDISATDYSNSNNKQRNDNVFNKQLYSGLNIVLFGINIAGIAWLFSGGVV